MLIVDAPAARQMGPAKTRQALLSMVVEQYKPLALAVTGSTLPPTFRANIR